MRGDDTQAVTCRPIAQASGRLQDQVQRRLDLAAVGEAGGGDAGRWSGPVEQRPADECLQRLDASAAGGWAERDLLRRVLKDATTRRQKKSLDPFPPRSLSPRPQLPFLLDTG